PSSTQRDGLSCKSPPNPARKPSLAPRAGWRIAEWAAAVGCCRGTVYNMVRRGEIELIQVGRLSIIRPGPDEYLDRKAGAPAEPALRPLRRHAGRGSFVAEASALIVSAPSGDC